MKVWFVTKLPAKFAGRWAESGITGMSLVDFIAADKTLIS
jgi:hypothetical protein